MNNKQYLTYIDEVALLSLNKRVSSVLKENLNIQEESDLGFAVAMDFNPSEEFGQAAVINLLAYGVSLEISICDVES